MATDAHDNILFFNSEAMHDSGDMLLYMQGSGSIGDPAVLGTTKYAGLHQLKLVRDEHDISAFRIVAGDSPSALILASVENVDRKLTWVAESATQASFSMRLHSGYSKLL